MGSMLNEFPGDRAAAESTGFMAGRGGLWGCEREEPACALHLRGGSV